MGEQCYNTKQEDVDYHGDVPHNPCKEITVLSENIVVLFCRRLN